MDIRPSGRVSKNILVISDSLLLSLLSTKYVRFAVHVETMEN